MSSSSEPWRQAILESLRTRNRNESEPFKGLIEANLRAMETTRGLQQENQRLLFSQQQERATTTTATEGGASSTAASSEEVSELKRKVYALQEELTELHRRKGENAQQVIDLSALAKQLESDVNEKAKQLLAREDDIEELKRERDRCKADLAELEQTSTMLKDELLALHTTLNVVETKLQQAEKENQRLVADVMSLKDRDVLKMNEENETFRRKQAEKVKVQLAEAAKERVTVVESGQTIGSETLNSLICLSCRLPNRAYIKFEAHDGDVNAIEWSPHGTILATAGVDRKIKLWDVSKGTHESKGVLAGCNSAIMSLNFDAAGAFLIAGSADFISRVWSLDDSRLRHTLTGHTAKVMAGKFMGDSNKVCTGSHDRTIKVWDLRTKATSSTFFPGSSCNDLQCLDNLIISGHFDKKLRFYDTRAGPQPTNEVVLDGRITSVDLSKCGQRLLASTRDDALNVLDLRSPGRSDIVRFEAPGFVLGCDWQRAVFSPDGQYISCGTHDGGVYIWNVDNPLKPERELREHEAVVTAVAWQPAGNCMTTCDKAKQVVVWADI